ncbi:MAG TPA: ABC transporter substrate-binding protein [Solirubrobacteraceae bacterium]|jgi:peptide/nickel transport system substrate-binding protein
MDRMLKGAFIALALAGAVLTGCGGDSGGGGGEKSTGAGAPVEGKTGGKLTVLWTDDVDNIDCGISYYQMGYMVCYATQRPLYSWKPEDGTTPVPDLATADPQVSEDGKTVTVKIRTGVKFSPPVSRDVTSKDVKYAIERGFFNTVQNGYAGAYFGDIVGAKVGAKPGTKIKGIETPDDQTIVFRLKRGTGGVLAGALALPLTAPVPQEYAAKFDVKQPSLYGQNQVATGPYMIENNAAGKAIGYEAGRRIHLVRNPNWDKTNDYKPAYLDEIDMPQGNDDTTVASRRVVDGNHMLTGDFSPPPQVLAQVVRNSAKKDQLALFPGGSARYVSMNTTIKPFDDINVRKAVIAGFNRDAMRLVRGGELVGDIPTHLLPPGLPGFEQAGGLKGPGLDFMSHPAGDAALSAEYFKKAGYASGKYEGKQTLLMVGTSEGVAEKAAEVAKENFEKMGFKVRLRLVTQDAMYTRFCNSPPAKVAICPNVSWGKDFADAQTILDPTFNGKNIVQQGNSNWPELDVPAINEAMDKAELLTDPKERAAAWAKIDTMVTEQAPLVPWIWDKQALLRSADTNGAVSEFNSMWDLAWTSLK